MYMRKTIGSLLVISLLTYSPAICGTVLNHDAIMWKALKDYSNAKAAIIFVEKSGEDIKEILDGEIDYLLAEIDNNSFKLTSLLKERKALTAKVDETIKEKATNKQRLTVEQVAAYQKYADVSYKKNIDVLACLNRIDDNKKLSNAENQLLHNNTDYNVIYDDIEQIRQAQMEAIVKLSDIVAVSNETLKLL